MTSVAAALVLALGLVEAGDAEAQALDDDDATSESDTDAAAAETTSSDGTLLEDPNKTRIGVGLRLRNVRIPEGLFEVFVEDVPAGVSNIGFGAELSRRRGNFEVQLGLEYEKLTAAKGHWREKNKDITGGNVDYVEDRDLAWYTAELSFMYHTPIIEQVSVRYGGGAGLALITGEVVRTDQICLAEDYDTCNRDPSAVNDETPYDLPPVFLVVNAIVGVQIRPTNEIFINVEGGLRTIPFFGATAGYYF